MSKNRFKYYKNAYNCIKNKEINSIFNNKIIFNYKGFDHLIRKNRKLRTISDTERRFYLLKYIKIVLENGSICEVRKLQKINFYSINYKINKVNIFVIIKESNNNFYFYSIFNK